MIRFLRRHAIAFIALVLALAGGTAYAMNTVRSADIVDGTIKSVDLANNAVTPAKSTGVWTDHSTSTAYTNDCAQTARTWTACAPNPITVPAGHQYDVTVISDMGAISPVTGTVAFCPATTGPSCMHDIHKASVV